jgi:hypothetical protein
LVEQYRPVARIGANMVPQALQVGCGRDCSRLSRRRAIFAERRHEREQKHCGKARRQNV